MDLQNALTRVVPNAAWVSGTITAASPPTGTPVLSNLTGTVDFDQSAVSVTRTAIGFYPLVITNFNPQGIGGGTSSVIATATCSTTGATLGSVNPAMIWHEPGTYSGDTLTVNFHIMITSTGLAQDTQFDFTVIAY